MDLDRRDPLDEVSVEEAIDRYIVSRVEDTTELSRRGWGYRLDQFRRFCDQLGIETVDELREADISHYRDWRAEDVNVVTLEGNLWTLKAWLEYLAAEGAIDDGLVDTVEDNIPDLKEGSEDGS